MTEYSNLDEAFLHFIPRDEPIAGLQSLLRSAFLSGATAVVCLLEEGVYSLPALKIELTLRLKPYKPDEATL
jgi:hypothetical protein